VGVTLEQSESLSVLRLQGAIDIASAGELKELLLKALELPKQESPKEVSVSLEGATDMDVTAVQLLWAAKRNARASGVRFSLSGAVPEQLLANLSVVGLQPLIEFVKAG
jgi:anti-anti-sigma factor